MLYLEVDSNIDLHLKGNIEQVMLLIPFFGHRNSESEIWLPFVEQYRTIFIQPDRQIQELVSAVSFIGIKQGQAPL